MSDRSRASAKWSVGELCFFEYELAQVKEIEEGGQVGDVTTGYVSIGSRDCRDRMVPVTMPNKIASEEVKRVERVIREEERGTGLNWPDIHHKLVALWLDCIDALEEKSDKPWDRLYAFKHAMVDSLHASREVAADGMRVFGR